MNFEGQGFEEMPQDNKMQNNEEKFPKNEELDEEIENKKRELEMAQEEGSENVVEISNDLKTLELKRKVQNDMRMYGIALEVSDSQEKKATVENSETDIDNSKRVSMLEGAMHLLKVSTRGALLEPELNKEKIESNQIRMKEIQNELDGIEGYDKKWVN